MKPRSKLRDFGCLSPQSKALQAQGQRGSNQPTPRRQGKSVGGQKKPGYLRRLVGFGALAAKTAKQVSESASVGPQRGRSKSMRITEHRKVLKKVPLIES